jgi:integrase
MAEEWFRLNGAGWRPGTQERYSYILRNFLKPLESLPLEQVQKIQVKHLLADLLAIRSPNTVQNPARGLLRRLLPAKKRRVQTPPDPFTHQDLAVFLQAAWQKLTPTLALILETMAMSGLRLGECLAMREDNLDRRHCQYQVTESTRAGRFGPPKAGKRLVYLDPALMAKLTGHVNRLKRASLAGGLSAGSISFPGDHPAHGTAGHGAGVYCSKVKMPESPRSAAYLRHPAPHGPLQPDLCPEAVGGRLHRHHGGHLWPLAAGGREEGPG